MAYFYNYPLINYQFGSETYPVTFQDISAYVDIIDNIKDDISFYIKYTILEGDRADIVSKKIYGSPDFYFTFYMMNDNIRERGWPLSSRDLEDRILLNHPNFVVTTKDNISDKLLVGTQIAGNSSGAVGTIIKRNLDLGQLIIKLNTGSVNFVKDEVITHDTGSGLETATTSSATKEFLSTHHYVDGDLRWRDVDPFQDPPAIYTPVTVEDHYGDQNNELKEIRIIKPDSMQTVYRAFQEALAS